MTEQTTIDDQILRELCDKERIRSLKFAYARYADAIDLEGMVSVFTEDCRVRFRPDVVLRGPQEVKEYYRQAQSVVTSSSHHLSNMDIVFQGPDTAAMHSYLYSWQRFTGYPDVRDRHRWARYEDVFVRTPEGWRQSELNYIVAGELASGDSLRVGEHRDRPIWTGESR
jgi:ketosteroid isomerase-like protein